MVRKPSTTFVTCSEVLASSEEEVKDLIKSNHWFIVPFAVGRLNCWIPYKL